MTEEKQPVYINPEWIEPLQDLANEVCRHMPEGYEIALCFEEGAATICMVEELGFNVVLPDPADKSLAEQLNEALLVANGWIK